MSQRLQVPTTKLPTLDLSDSVKPDAHLVIGLVAKNGKPDLVGLSNELESEICGKSGLGVLDSVLTLGAKTEENSVILLPSGNRLVSVVGLGDDAELTPDILRHAAASAVRAITKVEAGAPHHIAVSLDPASAPSVQAVTEGALLGAYTFAPISNTDAAQRIERIEIVCPSVSTDTQAAFTAGRAIATATCVSRDWVNLPANLLYPESFAESAKSYLSDVPVKVKILDEKDLAKSGFTGILAVGGGSDQLPRLFCAEYASPNAKFHLVLVGKGITFDTGGYNLKRGDGMYTMKSDMGGAAAVLAATHAIAQLGLKIKLSVYAPMAENMISGHAYRPSDVITMYGGKTVENTSSDAEGRLIMADALARSNEDHPDLVIDIATLTGACIVGLGNDIAGLMASDDKTADLVLDAAETAGEEFWQLPITKKIRKSLSSKVADIKSGAKRMGGAMVAGAFLQSFLDEGTNWAHLDIAGPSFNDEAPCGTASEGGTGAGVRTLVALASAVQE